MSEMQPSETRAFPVRQGEPVPAGRRAVRFRVSRTGRGEASEHFDEFTMSVGRRTTVLDALIGIRNELDSTLMLRHSCCHASCGTCGMKMNDREGLACVTKVEDLGDVVKVEPIANQQLVGDLVTDMVDFYAKFDLFDRPLIRSDEMLPTAAEPEGIEDYNRFENCIECGLCVSACPIVASDSRYLGPAALAAAERVMEEPRGRSKKATLRIVSGDQAAWRCHVAFECSEACPSNVDPAGKIMALRRQLAADRLRSLFGRGGEADEMVGTERRGG